jgi:hypothetical protein
VAADHRDNLSAAFLMMKSLLSIMKGRGWGRMVGSAPMMQKAS